MNIKTVEENYKQKTISKKTTISQNLSVCGINV